MKTNRISLTSILISIYLIINFVPVLYRSLSFASLFIVLSIIALNFHLIFRRPYSYLFIISFALCICELFLFAVGISKTQIGYIFYIFRFFTCGLVLFPSSNLLNLSEKKLIFWCWFLSYSFTILHNVYLRFSMGEAYFNFQEDASLVGYNIADTYYGTAALICLCVSLMVILNKNNYHRFLRTKMYVVFVLSVVFIIVSLRMTTIALAVLSSLLIILFNKMRKKGIVFLACLLVVFSAVFLFTGLGATFLELLMDLNISDRIKDRLESIVFVLRTGDFINAKSSLSGRYVLTINSWNTWTSSVWTILFGIGDQRENLDLIGNHSYFIDTLARFGIFYFILVIAFIVICHKCTLTRIRSVTLRTQCLVVLLSFLLRNVIGNSMYVVVGMSLYVVLPLILSMSKERFYESSRVAVATKKVLVL